MADSQVDIIIPVYNQTELTRACLESIKKNSDLPHNIIIIDNASGSQTRDFLEKAKAESPNITLIRNGENLGWVKAINQGIKASRAPYICIMNNDTVVRSGGWLSGLVTVALMSRDIGLINPRFEIKKKVPADEPFIEIDFCRGYCVLIKREVIDRIGGLDESYGLGYYDDDDLSVRAIRAGYRCVRANSVFVEHIGDSTFSDLFKDEKRRELHEKNKKLFYSKWGRRLKLLFIITKSTDQALLSKLLFSMARKQHIVYLWRTEKGADLRHTNIRETLFTGILGCAPFRLAILLNNRKSPEKRYDMVFTDSEDLRRALSKTRPAVYLADIYRDPDRVEQMVREASRI